MTTATQHWSEQLASLATLAPGWAYWDEGERWGIPPDEGALTTARRFMERVGDVGGDYSLLCGADPETGDVHTEWWRADGTLAVYFEAGLVCQMLAYQNPLPGFTINRDETPFDEALAIVRDWLSRR